MLQNLCQDDPSFFFTSESSSSAYVLHAWGKSLRFTRQLIHRHRTSSSPSYLHGLSPPADGGTPAIRVLINSLPAAASAAAAILQLLETWYQSSSSFRTPGKPYGSLIIRWLRFQPCIQILFSVFYWPTFPRHSDLRACVIATSTYHKFNIRNFTSHRSCIAPAKQHENNISKRLSFIDCH